MTNRHCKSDLVYCKQKGDEEIPNSKARIAANNRYNAKAYDKITLQVPKGQKDIIKEIASNHGLSINGYIQLAISKQLEEDSRAEVPADSAGAPEQ